MSEKLCALRKIGGGTLKETKLWTNLSPTSNFTGQTVTLSSDISDYTWLKFTYKKDTTTSEAYSVIYQVSDVKLFADSNGQRVGGLIIGKNTLRNVARLITYVSDTRLYISASARLEDSGVQDNNMVIPLAIYGLN